VLKTQKENSMQPFVFWPHAGAVGARAILELCAQFSWCELYGVMNVKKKKSLPWNSLRRPALCEIRIRREFNNLA